MDDANTEDVVPASYVGVRITLESIDFAKLVKGKVVQQITRLGAIEFALQDIGFDHMLTLIKEAMDEHSD